MIVEEITATWCPTCAEIDPELKQVADSHGSRIGLIALHPSDGEDAFQPAAAQSRIQRLQMIQPNIALSTPTFIVEGGTARVGYEAWKDVQRDILSTEVERQIVSTLEFQVETISSGFKASISNLSLIQENGTQLTFMLLQHEKEVPKGYVNPGEPTRDRVLIALAQCDIGGRNITTNIGFTKADVGPTCSNFSVEFEDLTSWSLILVHEQTLESLHLGESPISLGATELAVRSRATQSHESTASTFLLWFVFILAGATLLRKK